MGTRKTFHDLREAIEVWKILYEQIKITETTSNHNLNVDALKRAESKARTDIGTLYLVHRGLFEGAGQ